jgi:hypothetical protein
MTMIQTTVQMTAHPSTGRPSIAQFATVRSAIALFAGAIAVPGAASGQASEDAFIDSFRGRWLGSGVVQRDGLSSPRDVNCAITGTATKNHLSAQGSCRVAVIFGRPIGVDLDYDPASRSYQGVYTGSRIGPARLTGTRSGNAVNLKIAWPRPVNGDTDATMVIRNDGQGTVRIIVADNLSPGGPVQQTSEIVLRRNR